MFKKNCNWQLIKRVKRKAAILEDRRLYMPFLLPFN